MIERRKMSSVTDKPLRPDAKYGAEPIVITSGELKPGEMCFVQYLPIKMPGSLEIRIPRSLEWVTPLMDFVDFGLGDHVYLTAKNMFVTPDNMGNRPGWHTDGFGTNDRNWIWCNRDHTEICVQDFSIREDHDLSLIDMAEQAQEENVRAYPDNTFLLCDDKVVHRVPVGKQPGFRTFVRFSVSPDRYNLFGNAHNDLFHYNWEMQPRDLERNHTSKYRAPAEEV